ncbi:NAD(P)H-dependent oxidoreductase [Stappia sp. WLB 29]|uniref:NADPH-dependent FMN reductase n=1 Tax=Stappia sp. WLB 29 TaxID=2925220 RepID=UPI0020C026F0|nr:NAD(P)H-dependent oxidoreductase [Stappia sp. WLB 29]
MSKLKLGLLIGSTRKGRFADLPANWIGTQAEKTGAFDVEVIDLADFSLPFFGDPAASPAQTQAADAFAAKVAACDAYVFTVAEYNHSLTGVLKNALDHASWTRRPAGSVAYGGVGGARAVMHLRQIAVELEMVSVKAAVHISYGDYLALREGRTGFEALPHLGTAAERMLGQLAWWGRVLRSARQEERSVEAVA